MRRACVDSTGGVDSGFDDRKIAVPGMRTMSFESSVSRNAEGGGDTSAIRSASTPRPTCQSTITTNMAAPTTMGIHPPSTNLSRLAPKNGMSNERNRMSGGSAFHSGHPQVRRVTTK